MAKYIKKNTKYKLVYSNRVEVGENGQIIKRLRFGHRMETDDIFKELLNGMTSSHLKIIHKDIFKKIGLFCSRFDGVQDYDMYLRIALYEPDAFGFIDKFLYYHRIHDNQCTIVGAEIHKKNVNQVLSEARFRYEISNHRKDIGIDNSKRVCYL
jgi:hypothetical protein